MSICHLCGLNEYSDGYISCAECAITFESARQGHTGPWPNGMPAPEKSKSGGLFNAKISWDFDSMNSVQRWWAQSSEARIGSDVTDRSFAHTEPVGVFNVEGGNATITTSPLPCESCDGGLFFVSEICTACGCGPQQKVVLAAGTGDGVYGVWQDLGEPAQSIVVSFVRTTGEAPKLSDAITAMRMAAPLHLGTLSVAGALYIRDSIQGQLSIITAPGNYDVVAWIGRSPGMPSMSELMDFTGDSSSLGRIHDILLPVALTITQVDQERDLESVCQSFLTIADLRPSQVAASLWGDPSRTVHSHLQRVDESIAFLSGQVLLDEESGRQKERGIGHMIFHALTIGRDDFGTGMDAYLDESDSHALFSSACMLMAAGHSELAFARMKMAAIDSKLAALFASRMERRINAGEDLFPIWGLMTSEYMEYLAQRMAPTDKAASLDLWLMTADRGLANGASFYTWDCLARGAYQEAVDMYLSTRDFCIARAARLYAAYQEGNQEMADPLASQLEQLDNSKTNTGVAHIALGSPDEEVLEFLKNEENAEAILYRSLYHKRSGRDDESGRDLSTISGQAKQSLHEMCDRMIRGEATDPWLIEWFEDCRALLNSAGKAG